MATCFPLLDHLFQNLFQQENKDKLTQHSAFVYCDSWDHDEEMLAQSSVSSSENSQTSTSASNKSQPQSPNRSSKPLGPPLESFSIREKIAKTHFPEFEELENLDFLSDDEYDTDDEDLEDLEKKYSTKEDEDVASKEQEYFDAQVESVVLGQSPLLEVDPQTTGINFLQLATRTWAEFASIVFEYKESMAESDPTKELPDWLIEREDKMLQLGRKARLLSSALEKLDDKFGLKDVSIKADRVKTQVELRLQRLAEWNYKNIVDTSKFSARVMTRDANSAMDVSDVA